MIIDGEVAVTVEHIKSLPEFRQRSYERPASSEQLIAIERVVDLDAPLRAVTVLLNDHFAQIADAENNARKPIFLQEAELVRKERLPRHLNQKLRHLLGDRTKASSQAAGEEGDGQIGRRGKVQKRKKGKVGK